MKHTLENIYHLCTLDGGSLRVADISEAYRFCKHQALGHYENFPVGSLLIPSALQPAVYAIYTFSRIADDIADEAYPLTPQERLALLDQFEQCLMQTTAQTRHPIFGALHDTIRRHHLPLQPFLHLLTAFRQDCDHHSFASWTEADDYCARSANPVGELLLRLYGLWDNTRKPFSDAICTGLQYANFWQDLSRDLAQNRCYIPYSELENAGLCSDDIFALYASLQSNLGKGEKTSNFRQEMLIHNAQHILPQFEQCLQHLIEKTDTHFRYGCALLSYIPYMRLRAELALTMSGGRTILRQTQALQAHILVQRPSLGIRHGTSMIAHSIRFFSSSYFRSSFSSSSSIS
jgi:squalene synthase HpnC